MEKTYPFDPISSAQEIRMLALNPGEKEDPITCTLSHVSLDADPEYEALSYTWDTDVTTDTGQDTEIINCSGHEVLVRENLFAALRRLRYPDRPRFLWIDAICINQADNEEKSQQVALMGSIYANAKEVVIWLGEEEVDDALAFDTIIRFKRVFEKEPTESYLLPQMWDSKGGPDEIPTYSGNEWRGLSNLLKKRWFSRVWIVQEIALARSATLVCGDLALDWKRFFYSINHILNSSLRTMLWLHGPPHGIPTLIGIAKILDMRDSNEPLRLFDFLFFTCGLQATDPRDKIFSLLGLLSFAGEDTEHVKDKKPWSLDYNIPIDELFRNVTAYYLLDEGRFEILSFVNHGSRLYEHGTSSWILPRYIPPENIHTPLGVYLKATRKAAKPIGRYPYSHSHPNQIGISGVLVDHIRALSTVLESSFESHKIMPANEKTLERNCRAHRYTNECISMYSELVVLSSGDAPCLTADAFWRTMMCNTTDSFLTPGPEYGRSFSIWCETGRLLNEFASTGRTNWSRKDIEDLGAECLPFERSWSKWNPQRRFCTTEGRRLGMVPRAAQEGDIIRAFLGANTPFVLRPDGNGNYRLVGECYVQGLMCGESSDIPGFMEKVEDIVLV